MMNKIFILLCFSILLKNDLTSASKIEDEIGTTNNTRSKRQFYGSQNSKNRQNNTFHNANDIQAGLNSVNKFHGGKFNFPGLEQLGQQPQQQANPVLPNQWPFNILSYPQNQNKPAQTTPFIQINNRWKPNQNNFKPQVSNQWPPKQPFYQPSKELQSRKPQIDKHWLQTTSTQPLIPQMKNQWPFHLSTPQQSINQQMKNQWQPNIQFHLSTIKQPLNQNQMNNLWPPKLPSPQQFNPQVFNNQWPPRTSPQPITSKTDKQVSEQKKYKPFEPQVYNNWPSPQTFNGIGSLSPQKVNPQHQNVNNVNWNLPNNINQQYRPNNPQYQNGNNDYWNRPNIPNNSSPKPFSPQYPHANQVNWNQLNNINQAENIKNNVNNQNQPFNPQNSNTWPSNKPLSSEIKPSQDWPEELFNAENQYKSKHPLNQKNDQPNVASINRTRLVCVAQILFAYLVLYLIL